MYDDDCAGRRPCPDPRRAAHRPRERRRLVRGPRGRRWAGRGGVNSVDIRIATPEQIAYSHYLRVREPGAVALPGSSVAAFVAPSAASGGHLFEREAASFGSPLSSPCSAIRSIMVAEPPLRRQLMTHTSTIPQPAASRLQVSPRITRGPPTIDPELSASRQPTQAGRPSKQAERADRLFKYLLPGSISGVIDRREANPES